MVTPGVVAPDGEVMVEAVTVDELEEEEEGEKNLNPEGLDAVDLCILGGGERV